MPTPERVPESLPGVAFASVMTRTAITGLTAAAESGYAVLDDT